MKIMYKNKDTERICTDLKYANKKMNTYGRDLLGKINLIKNMLSFEEVMVYSPFHCHRLQGGLKDFWSLDVKGRKCQWRIIVAPVDEDGNIVKANDRFNNISKTLNIILIEEVSKHYER